MKIWFARQCTRAVTYSHNLKPAVLHNHRDIKPANVLVAKGFMTKLCDMGISKLKVAQSMSFGTSIGISGTPSYMAPECFLQRESASISSNVWSLTCTLLLQSLLTLKMSWIYSRKFIERTETPSSLVLLQNTVNIELWHVLSQCFNYTPACRPSGLNIIKVYEL